MEQAGIEPASRTYSFHHSGPKTLPPSLRLFPTSAKKTCIQGIQVSLGEVLSPGSPRLTPTHQTAADEHGTRLYVFRALGIGSRCVFSSRLQHPFTSRSVNSQGCDSAHTCSLCPLSQGQGRAEVQTRPALASALLSPFKFRQIFIEHARQPRSAARGIKYSTKLKLNNSALNKRPFASSQVVDLR